MKYHHNYLIYKIKNEGFRSSLNYDDKVGLCAHACMHIQLLNDFFLLESLL